MMSQAEDALLIRRLVDAAEAVEIELAQEGARTLRSEERSRVKQIYEELEDLSLAVVYDDPELLPGESA